MSDSNIAMVHGLMTNSVAVKLIVVNKADANSVQRTFRRRRRHVAVMTVIKWTDVFLTLDKFIIRLHIFQRVWKLRLLLTKSQGAVHPYQCVTGCDNQAYSQRVTKRAQTRLDLQIIAWPFLSQLFRPTVYQSLAAIRPRPISCLNATFAMYRPKCVLESVSFLCQIKFMFMNIYESLHSITKNVQSWWIVPVSRWTTETDRPGSLVLRSIT